MLPREKPSILVIDDEPEELLRLNVQTGLGERATSYVIHPQCVELSHLEQADLVLIDYLLLNWPERENLPTVSLQPANGLALAGVLREQVDQAQYDSLTAFALHTGHLDDIRGRLPSVTAEHVLGRLNNLEWAFSKAKSRRFDQMVILAQAVRQLPNKWPKEPADSTAMAKSLLSIDSIGESSERCWHDIQECRVPVHDIAKDGHGILFLRWLLHEVLPYPTFLWAEHWVAARLKISLDGLHEVMKGSSRLAKDLDSLRYTGILAGFLGDRWWRGALEDYVWELAHSSGGKTFTEALTERAAGIEVTPIDDNPAVVCLNEDFEPTGLFRTPMTAVTIRPDHWPAFADSAWMDIRTVLDSPSLLSLVDPIDQHRVSNDVNAIG